MKLKVCGITELENAKALERIGIDWLGFNFYQPSKRYISPTELSEWITKINMPKVGIFVQSDVDNIRKVTEQCTLDYAQLHGDESVTICESVQAFTKVIKVFRVDDAFDWSTVQDFDHCADIYLFDTKTKGEFGGSGEQFNWSSLIKYTGVKPYLIAGGIGPDDASNFTSLSNDERCLGLDLNSKFETEPGVKNEHWIQLFKEKIDDYDRSK